MSSIAAAQKALTYMACILRHIRDMTNKPSIILMNECTVRGESLDDIVCILVDGPFGISISFRRRSSGAHGHAQGKRRQNEDKFSVAMDSLHVSAVPKSLPCRTRERDKLLQFLKSNVKSGENEELDKFFSTGQRSLTRLLRVHISYQ